MASAPAFVYPAPDASQKSMEGGLNLGCGSRVLACLIGAMAFGCDVGFVEAEPPQLRQVSASFTAKSVAEPVVFGMAVDFELPDPDACASALAWIEGVANSALPQAPAILLPEQRLSANTCTIAQEQTFDPQPLIVAMAAAKSRFPSAHIRPVLLFVTNLQLPLQSGVVHGLSQLAALAEKPEIWALAPGLPASSFAFNRSLPWTFTQDPAVLQAVTSLAASVLPFQSAPAQEETVSLAASDVRGMTLMKLCGTSEVAGAIAASSTPQFDGATAVPVGGSVPVFDFASPQLLAVPKSEFVIPAITVKLEGCTADCHHLFDGNEDGPGTAWDTTRGCSNGKVTP
jgi:hypothetical protein